MAREATRAVYDCDEFRILLEGRSRGAIDGPPEYLCVDRNENGGWTVQRRRYLVLGELGEFMLDDEDGEVYVLPATINGRAVGQVEGSYLLGDDLVPCDWESDFELTPDNSSEVHAWLDRFDWTQQRGFAAAWREICRLAGWVVELRPRRACALA
jgi:hypothetical protein